MDNVLPSRLSPCLYRLFFLFCVFIVSACSGSGDSERDIKAGAALQDQSITIAVDGDGYLVLSARSGGYFYRRSATLKLDRDGRIVTGKNESLLQGLLASIAGKIPSGGGIGDLNFSVFDIDISQLELDESGLFYNIVDGKPVGLGQIALAVFENPAGLTELGPDGDEWAESYHSGLPVINLPNTNNYGRIKISYGLSPDMGSTLDSATAGEYLLNNNLTLSIWGHGYLSVKREGTQAFIRNGRFGLDDEGRLATDSGWVLQAYGVKDEIIDYELVTDLAVTESGVDLTAIDFNDATGLFYAGEMPLGLLQMAYYKAPLFLNEIDPNVWQETVASGPPLLGFSGSAGRGRVVVNRFPSEEDYTLELAVDGAGYLLLENELGQSYYTRATILQTDAANRLINAEGYLLQGNITIPSSGGEVEVSSTGDVSTIPFGQASLLLIGQLDLALFSNPDGLERVADGVYAETASSGPPAVGKPRDPGFGVIVGDTMF